MNSLIKFAIERPVAVMAMMILTVMFGIVSSQIIPIQMSPDIEKPILQVRMSWSGASPEDVDREIVSRLETELSGLSGVEDIASRSDTGRARVTLTYGVGTDMDKALTMLLSELSGITDLPDEASAPQVRTSNSDDSPIARLALTATQDSGVDVEKLGNFLEDGIVAPLERVSGVAEIFLYGGGRREMRVEINPNDLIRYNLGLPQILQALRQASATLSVGTIDRGKRTYTVRTQANLFTPQTAGQIVVRNDLSASGQLVPVLLSDIATIRLVTKKRTSFRRLNGKDAVILNALREQNSNVVETMTRLRGVIDELNSEILQSRGLNLRVVYDETDYIASAIDLVKQNIWIGGLLALTILILFLRSFAPTFIIFMAIPTSVIGTFVAMAGLGMSINVISLAGLAFAVGMVVDASIVSQENIYRLRQKGLSAPQAAFHGARQVWAPILGSALTTVVVFVPVIMLKLPVGQLFRDIGVAISVSVLISVLVSTTLIP
ncbi:MAG: efflux RND transporter permease subunit, partial [Candidatus Puniceispirillaceae bacterium]